MIELRGAGARAVAHEPLDSWIRRKKMAVKEVTSKVSVDEEG
jgi:hypothetical protein